MNYVNRDQLKESNRRVYADALKRKVAAFGICSVAFIIVGTLVINALIERHITHNYEKSVISSPGAQDILNNP